MNIHDIKWFIINESAEEDLGMVFNFIRRIPRNLETIMESGFYNLLETKDISGLNFKSFKAAFNEMENSIDNFFRGSNEIFRESKSILIKDAGLIGANLRLKADLLNHLWEKVIGKIKEIGSELTNLWDRRIVPYLSDFLKYLNVLLGSIVSVFPPLEIVKEFKDLIECASITNEELVVCPMDRGRNKY